MMHLFEWGKNVYDIFHSKCMPSATFTFNWEYVCACIFNSGSYTSLEVVGLSIEIDI